MPDCKQNKFEGVYKFRAAYPMQKRYQILKDFAATGSLSVSTRENRVSYNTARSICDKFVTTGDCQPRARGRPACKMQPFMAAYLEAMVLVNPFLYLEEMQDRLMIDLNLLQNEVPSVPVICRTLHELNLSKHKSFSERHPFQRFLIGLPNNAVSILGATSRGLHASLAGNVFSTQKRLTDETTYEHTRNLFFKVIRKSLYRPKVLTIWTGRPGKKDRAPISSQLSPEQAW